MMLLFAGCTKQTPLTPPPDVALPPRLDWYFENYCDYTGSLGIGFDPSHTYDYRFRQRLKTTLDPELKRLFVLQQLHRDVEYALDDFEKGIVRTGKSSSRPLTFSEWQSARQSIRTQIGDLDAYSAFSNFSKARPDRFDSPNPSLDSSWIEELRGKLRSVTNTPATKNGTAAPPR